MDFKPSKTATNMLPSSTTYSELTFLRLKLSPKPGTKIRFDYSRFISLTITAKRGSERRLFKRASILMKDICTSRS